MRKKIVIALGGNALGKNPAEQLELVKTTAKSIVDLVSEGHYVVVTHGNGPQVGMINLAMELLKKLYPDREIIPIYAREILLGGGNIHCITQQVPARIKR